ncbi:MAG TPA: biosynthetic-type acetolactate synthase large subunit [Pyrinomonadaceae bacterium]|nr:biosynthetic-type acetolactate synthase large subunit [Pyrinomonadaceae bacterium]
MQTTALRTRQPISQSGVKKMRGAGILLESLLLEGVDTIFGYPGGAVLHIYDELKKFNGRLRHILCRHEQGAVHMAEGYALATGKTGVVLATSGPGATNTVTGIANAFMDSTPLVVITGQVPRPMIGTMAFQEVDIAGITRPCTKYNYVVDDVSELAEIVHEAFYIASSGRPGPVLIDIPKDVTAEICDFDPSRRPSIRKVFNSRSANEKQISDCLELIARAHKPVFYIGGGLARSNALGELMQLVELLDYPVATTLMGLGAFPAKHTNCLGMLGMHGHFAANCALAEADLIIAVGVRFDDRVTGDVKKFAPFAKIIHIDIDASSVRQNIKIHLPLTGDAKQILSQILLALSQKQLLALPDLNPWWGKIHAWQKNYPLTYQQSEEMIKPQFLCEVLSKLTNNDAIISTDVGQHQMWLAQYYGFRRARQSLTSGGLGTMGFGLPAALGAQLAFPEKQVIAFVGDGGFQMTSQELATAVQYRTNLKVIIMNNSSLGMVRQWQELLYDKNYSEIDLAESPDFVKLAQAYGAKGLRAKKPSHLEAVLNEGLNTKGVVVMDIQVAPEECVFPMIPPGAGHKEMRLR